MKSNKLIAEFMGIRYAENRNSHKSSDYYYEDIELEYHTSWDWLMPVVVRLFDVIQYNEFDGADNLSFRLNDTLLETNLDSLYNIVVEFINEYNKTI
tara:strand:- start:137 stop:427 length:291 start_codon:yes stop_codon:yes gene_type:complete